MKLTSLLLTLGALATVLVACKRESGEAPSVPPGTVAFPGSGVSLSVDAGWKRADVSAGSGHCPPTLVGAAGMIQVMVLLSGRSDPQAAVKGLRADFDVNPNAKPGSFKQEAFTTGSGLRGIRVSCSYRSEKDATENRSYSYVVRNREGRGVSVNYVATEQSDSDAVHQMIRQSLRLSDGVPLDEGSSGKN